MSRKLLQAILLITAVMALTLTSYAGNAPVPASESDTPVQLEVYPELIYQVSPQYPEIAKKNGTEGKVYVKLFVSQEGNVTKKEIQKSSGSPLLDSSALTAAEKFKFKPGILDGKPVAAWVTIPIEFKLDEKKQTGVDPAEIDVMPEMIHQTSPQYPEKAKMEGVEGDVWIKALVDSQGKVAEVLVEKSTCADCGFEESALKAALEYKFKPAIKNNLPVKAWVTFKVSFQLDTK